MHSLIFEVTPIATDIPWAAITLGYFFALAIAIIPVWVIFTKAGEPGWQAIIPIWSTIVLLKIAGKPWWWILLLWVPMLNIVLLVLVLHALSTSFGHGAGFTAGLFFLSLIFMYILAFDSSRYQGAGGVGAARPAYATA